MPNVCISVPKYGISLKISQQPYAIIHFTEKTKYKELTKALLLYIEDERYYW